MHRGDIMISKIDEMQDLICELKDLVRLDYAIIEAYEISIKKLKNKEFREKLLEFKANHNSHINNITRFLKENGYKSPTGPGLEKFLIQGKAILKTLKDDLAVLNVMRSNEHDAYRASQNISIYDLFDSSFKKNLVKKCKDEKRHLSWFEEKCKMPHL